MGYWTISNFEPVYVDDEYDMEMAYEYEREVRRCKACGCTDNERCMKCQLEREERYKKW